MSRYYPMWAEVELGAITRNIISLKSLTKPGTRFMAVVKAEAYGHGLENIASTAVNSGAEWLGVARAEEGIRLREAGITGPVLVFGMVTRDMIEKALKKDLTLTVYDKFSARFISDRACSLNIKAPVHIKVDTGMGRLGFPWHGSAVEEIEDVVGLPGLECRGIYTHFAEADSPDKTYTLKQFERFRDISNELCRRGIEFHLRHAANSAALIDLPETHLDMVRSGISIYGLYPSGDVHKSRVSLKPAMSLKTLVAQVKDVVAGCPVSYGCTYFTDASTKLATLAVGYADGYNRLLSSKGQVLLRGQRAPVVGRVCMDQCVVDAGHIPGVSPGDEVVIMGNQGDDNISADEIAGAIETINYEVLTGVSSRVPRFYT